MSDPADPARSALRLLRRVSAWRVPSPRWRGLVFLLAAAVFAVGVVWSLLELDLDVDDLVWWPLVVVAVAGTPATIVVNAAELRAMARCVDPAVDLPWRRAVHVVVVATAANVLPLPGGALVRVHALTRAGVGVGRATGVNLAAAGVWVAAAVLVAGTAGLAYAPAAAGLALALGAVGLVVGVWLLRAVALRWSARAAGGLVAVEVVTTLVHAARLLLVLLGVGVAVVPAQAMVLSAAAPLAAAAGVFPSGLGLAELISALLAPAVALSVAAGFAATALARVIGLAATLPVALVLGVRDLAGEAASTERVVEEGRDLGPGDRP